MAFIYQTSSITQNFELQAMLGEGIAICVYGATWYGTNWLSDPTAALTAVNDAFDSVADLAFSGIQVFSGLTQLGTGLAFAVVDPVYKNRTYLGPDDVGPLRANIASALNTIGIHFHYGDVVLGTSKSGS